MIVAAVDVQFYRTHRHIYREVACVAHQGIDAIGVEDEGTLDAATHKLHSQEIVSHQLINRSDYVHVDESATAYTVDDAHTCGGICRLLVHVGGILAKVTCCCHDDATGTHQLVQCLTLKDTLPRERDALATAQIDDTGLAITLSAVKDVLETQHGDSRRQFIRILKVAPVGIEVGQVYVALGCHSLKLAVDSAACHRAKHVSTVGVAVGMLGMAIGDNLIGCFQRMAACPILVGPQEVIVILHTRVPVTVKK